MSRPIGSTDAESSPHVVLCLDTVGIVITLFGMSETHTNPHSATAQNGSEMLTLSMRSDSGAKIRCTIATIDGVSYFRAFVDGVLEETSEGGQARRDWKQAKVLARY